jgi:hypothetical protein
VPVLVSVNDGDAGAGTVTVSAFFRLPNGTTQLLANVASVLDAVGCGGCVCVCICGSTPGRAPTPDPDPKGDARATWYDAVRRRCINNCDIPSESDFDGDGGPASNAGSDDNGTAENVGSVNAVVATAFTAAGELVTVASVGGRAEDILDVVESRDAREPGRNGEDVRGCDVAEPADGGTKGGDGADTPLSDSDGDDGGGCGCGEGEGSGSELGGDIGTSTLDGGTTTDVGSSDDSRDAWASNRESDEGPADGVEFARGRAGNKCEVGGCVALNESSTWA